MSGAVCSVGLGAAAGVNPHTDGRGLGVGRVLGGDGEAIAEGGALGLGAVADGGCKTAEARQRVGLDAVDGGAGARGVLQVQGEPTGSHGRGHCVWARRVCLGVAAATVWSVCVVGRWPLFLRFNPPRPMVSTAKPGDL